MKTFFENQTRPRRRAFTLIELLVVIAIIAVLAALTLTVMSGVSKTQKISVVRAEMQQIETALENYKDKYGAYPPCNPNNVLANQLYYELSGTYINAGYYVPLGGGASIPTNMPIISEIFNVGGFVNAGTTNNNGSGDEDARTAGDFLPGLKSTEITSATNNASGVLVSYLVTSVGGPDTDYQPIPGGNPFRYLYPGTNNPNSYDLWVQLSIGSTFNSSGNLVNPKRYLICNWNQQAQINNPLP